MQTRIETWNNPSRKVIMTTQTLWFYGLAFSWRRLPFVFNKHTHKYFSNIILFHSWNASNICQRQFFDAIFSLFTWKLDEKQCSSTAFMASDCTQTQAWVYSKSQCMKLLISNKMLSTQNSISQWKHLSQNGSTCIQFHSNVQIHGNISMCHFS